MVGRPKSGVNPPDSLHGPLDTVRAQRGLVQAGVFSQRVPLDSRRAPGARARDLHDPVQAQPDLVQGQLISERAPVNSVRALMNSVRAPVDSIRAPVDSVQAPLDTKRIQ
jgi:hypothetical protein